MAFIGNTNTTQAFTPAIDYFSGNGSTTAFTLSRPVASVAQVQAVVNNVAQNPSSAFTVSGNTITFTSAPSSGTNNIYVYYTSPITQVATLTQNPVITGNLNFGSTGARITGDFSNATFANRVAFQTSTTNGATTVLALPNGTGTTASWDAYNNSDPTNSSYLGLSALSTEVRLSSTIRGTGTYLPMTFYTNGSERMRIDTSGNVLIGSSTANAKLYSYATSGTTTTLGRFEAAIGSYTGTSLIAANTLGASSSFNLFSCITDSDGDAGGPVTQFLVRGDGNVGIGTSSPAVKLDVNGITGWQGNTTGIAASVAGANAPVNGGGNLRVVSTTTQAADLGGSLTLGGSYHSGGLYIDFAEIAGRKSTSTSGDSAGYLSFGTRVGAGNITERMRIDSSGNLLVGKTSTSSTTTGVIAYGTGAADHGMISVARGSNATMIEFRTTATGNVVGQISQNGSNTTYSTSSDYRLKENIAPMNGALAKVIALKPVTYTWKATGESDEGFIAHELQEVCPSAVTGEKDAVDADGNPIYQGIDTSFLVATLTAAIQEQQALITALTARIETLENK